MSEILLIFVFKQVELIMLITIITLVLAAAGFVWGRIRADIVALIALLVLTLSGILTTQ